MGFARVLRALATAAQPRVDYRMAEFFVARARRRLGIGRTAVQLILSRFAGRWEITEYLRNAGGGEFLAPRGRRLHAGQLPGAHRQRRSAPGVCFREAAPVGAGGAGAAAGRQLRHACARAAPEPGRVPASPGSARSSVQEAQRAAAPTAVARCCRAAHAAPPRATTMHRLHAGAHAMTPAPSSSATR